jgi:hypothetical protein
MAKVSKCRIKIPAPQPAIIKRWILRMPDRTKDTHQFFKKQ